MKVVDRINEILQEKKLTKKELANRLINLEIKTNKTGEIPSISTIYAYLNGKIEIKADMLPLIAEALNIHEQEFFTDEKRLLKILTKVYGKEKNSSEYEKIIELLEYVSPKTLFTLEELLVQNKKRTEELNGLIKIALG